MASVFLRPSFHRTTFYTLLWMLLCRLRPFDELGASLATKYVNIWKKLAIFYQFNVKLHTKRGCF